MSNQALASSVAAAAAGLVAAATGGGYKPTATAQQQSVYGGHQQQAPPSPSAYRPGVVTYRPKSVNGSQEIPKGAFAGMLGSALSPTAPASPITPERA